MTKFDLAHDVTIDRPVTEVFPVLGLADDLERVLRLSSLVTSFKLVEIVPGSTPSEQVITFEFGEKVYGAKLTMRVEQTVDTERRRVDYWSQTKNGRPLSVHKVRTFEAVGESTRVAETVHGEAPFGLHLLVRGAARKAHRDHMDSYHRLFEG